MKQQKRMKKGQMMLCLAVMAFLAAITFHLLFQNHSAAELTETFSSADLRYVALALLCMIVFISCEARNVRAFMRTFQRKIPLIRSIQYACADFYFSAITPSATGGQPMQLYYMTRDGHGFAQSSFTLLAVYAVYQMTVLGYGAVMILAHFHFVRQQDRLIQWLLVFGIAVNGVCSAAILLVILKRALVERIMEMAVAALSRLKIIKDRRHWERKAENLIDEYSRGGEYLKKCPNVVLQVVFYTILQLTALYLVPYFASLALGIHGADIMDFLTLQAILSLAVTAVPLPGSVGASEGGFLLLYQGLFLAGEEFPLMMLSRGVSFYGFLLISALSTVFLQFSEKGRCKS